MRLNRGTIILLVALVVVIAGALLISSQQTSVSTPTPTPDTEAGALFPIAGSAAVTRLEVRDTTTGQFIELTRTDSGGWAIAGSNARPEFPNDVIIEQNLSSLITTQYTARFASDAPGDFGLTQPTYVLFVETADAGYTLYVGSRAPTTPRYYVTLAEGIVQPVIAADATPEVTPELTFEPVLPDPFFALTPAPLTRPGAFPLSGGQTVAVIPQTAIVTLTGWLITPPYLPPTPTPAPTETPTPQPEATAEVTPEATAEGTAEAGS
jgi:hypothetical protein